MDYVSGLIFAVALSGLETSADFNEVWYREVVLGEVSYAASTYDRIYTQRSPWQRSTEDERRLAALRAGLCYERLGRVAEARLAYDWLCQHGLHGSEPVDVARSRLGELTRSGSLSGAAELGLAARSGEVSLVRDALADHVKIARGEVARGREELKSLEVELSGLKRHVELARSLRADLETLGVGVFAGSTTLFATPSRGVSASETPRATPRTSRRSFRGRLEARLRTVLTEGFSFENILPGVADAFCGSALRAVVMRDVAAAKRNFEQALALSSHHAAARDFVEKLGSREDSRGLDVLARRYLLEERLRQIGVLQGEIREKLESARRRRPDRGVELIVDIWDLAARALPEVRREAEISQLLRDADRLFLVLTTGVSRSEGERPAREESCEKLRKYLREREVQIQEARASVREIVELTTEKLLTEEDTSAWGRPEVVVRELQRLLAEGRSFLVAGAVAECGRSVRKVELLLAWFPDLDSRYRAQRSQLREELEELERQSLQEELERQSLQEELERQSLQEELDGHQ